MEKNRRELSRNTVLSKPSSGLTPSQHTVSIRQSPNKSGRGIHIDRPVKSMVLPPRRKNKQSESTQEYPEQYEEYPEQYEAEEFITDDEAYR